MTAEELIQEVINRLNAVSDLDDALEIMNDG